MQAEVARNDSCIKEELDEWVFEYGECIGKGVGKLHICYMQKPFFILLVLCALKIHKYPYSLQANISGCGSFLYLLQIWVDNQLQPVGAAAIVSMPSYFISKEDLCSLELLPDASLFVSNVVSTYTNVLAKNALQIRPVSRSSK